MGKRLWSPSSTPASKVPKYLGGEGKVSLCMLKIYNRLSTESNIGSRKISMDELVFFKFFLISMLTCVYYTFSV